VPEVYCVAASGVLKHGVALSPSTLLSHQRAVCLVPSQLVQQRQVANKELAARGGSWTTHALRRLRMVIGTYAPAQPAPAPARSVQRLACRATTERSPCELAAIHRAAKPAPTLYDRVVHPLIAHPRTTALT
jgi:hypothetical protein